MSGNLCKFATYILTIRAMQKLHKGSGVAMERNKDYWQLIADHVRPIRKQQTNSEEYNGIVSSNAIHDDYQFVHLACHTGFASSLYRYVTNTTADNRDRNALMNAYKSFRRNDDLHSFIEAIKTFYASVPYQWAKDNGNEHFYHALLYTLLMAFGADIRAEEPTANGHSDLTLLMPKGIYVMELKYDSPASVAIDQINRKGYANKYALDGRAVTKVGISFSSKERNITEWMTEKGNIDTWKPDFHFFRLILRFMAKKRLQIKKTRSDFHWLTKVASFFSRQ